MAQLKLRDYRDRLADEVQSAEKQDSSEVVDLLTYKTKKEALKQLDQNIVTINKKSGKDAKDMIVDKLDGDTAGQYNIKNDTVTLDENFLHDNKIVNIGIHEFEHQKHHQARNKKGVKTQLSVEREEGIVATIERLESGSQLAYQSETRQLDKELSTAQSTRTRIVELFRQGEVDEINEILDQEPELLAA